jgi:hypothetical protein
VTPTGPGRSTPESDVAADHMWENRGVAAGSRTFDPGATSTPDVE